MKFSPLLLLLATTCLSSCYSSSADLFPVKVSPLYSKFWSVEYFDTYKIAKNLATNTSYLLYQNGTQPPSSASSSSDVVVIEIPLTGDIGVTETPIIPFLELLGVQTRVKAYLGDKAFIASPCFLELISQGTIVDFTGNASSSKSLAASNLNASALVTFATVYDAISAIAKPVYISEYLELTNEAVYEWLKFYSLFFNMESEANQLCNETIARTNCVKENAASVSTGSPVLPVVMWAYYSTYANGWSLATCPNYYCEFATTCSATLLPAVNGSIEAYGANFLTDEEFYKFGQNATYWIFPSNDWNTIYASKMSILANFTSVVNKQVYDYQGMGENAWFEERIVEYDVVTQDFCTIVGKYVASPTLHKRVWFRNVFTEPIGSLGQCTDPSAPLQSPATQCVTMGGASSSVTGTSTASPVRSVGAAVVSCLLVVAAAFNML